jgi:hypothetical protein
MMIPQSYPLVIEDWNGSRWLVAGWEGGDGVYEPVVMPASLNTRNAYALNSDRCPWRVVEYGPTGAA